MGLNGARDRDIDSSFIKKFQCWAHPIGDHGYDTCTVARWELDWNLYIIKSFLFNDGSNCDFLRHEKKLIE